METSLLVTIGGEASGMMICLPQTWLVLIPLLADTAKPTWLSTSREFRYFLQDLNAAFGDPQRDLSLVGSRVLGRHWAWRCS